MFLKYLSIGNDLRHLALMFNNLECIQMCPVSFMDMKEILVVLRLIKCSPNLKELHISVSSKDMITCSVLLLIFTIVTLIKYIWLIAYLNLAGYIRHTSFCIYRRFGFLGKRMPLRFYTSQA